MTTGIPDSLERLSHTDLIGVVRELIGEVGRLRTENEKLSGALKVEPCLSGCHPQPLAVGSAMLMDVHQRGNLRFPQSLPEFQRLFPDDAACAAYLEKARWSDGFVCPHCQAVAERHPSRGQSPAPASLPQRIHLPLQQAVLSVQRLPFPARHRGRRHRTDLRRALLRSLAAPYMLGVWVTTG